MHIKDKDTLNDYGTHLKVTNFGVKNSKNGAKSSPAKVFACSQRHPKIPKLLSACIAFCPMQ
jgi:hypothetical protein